MRHYYYNKFGAHKKEVDDRVFDSILEADRYIFLKEAEKKGIISDLRCQVPYELIPAQWETITIQQKTKAKEIRRCKERAVKYIADFVYIFNGKEIIEDTKGIVTKEYSIKRKLMRYQGHPIREIKNAKEGI